MMRPKTFDQNRAESRRASAAIAVPNRLTSSRDRTPISSVIQRAAKAPHSLTPAEVAQLQRTIGNAAVARLTTEAALRPNETGLPDGLKAGVEALSGLAMDDVRVHYNSPSPARLQAQAYAQSPEIHVAPGQEKHLPHEAWHIVQQKQGRVKPTLQMTGVAINDESGLESEADAMGARALKSRADEAAPHREHSVAALDAPIQRRVGFEFESNIPVGSTGENVLEPKKAFFSAPGWHVEPDRDYMEFVTDKLTTSDEVFAIMDDIVDWVDDLLAVPIVMPDEELEDIRIAAEKEGQRELEQKLKFSTLEPNDVIDSVVKAYEVERKIVEQWVVAYGVLAVDMFANDEATKKEVKKNPSMKEYLGALMEFTAKSAKIKPQREFHNELLEIIDARAFRPLEKMKRNKGLQGLVARGAVREVTAAPQATIGVTLDKLIDAMHLIPTEEVLTGINTQQQATRTLSEMSPQDGALLIDARRRAMRAIAPLRRKIEAAEKDWRELEGVVALMVSYILKGNEPRDAPFEDAKLIAPLMTRVNFSAMYRALAPAMQKLFEPSLIAKAAGYAGSTRVFGNKGFGKNLEGPTIEQWVTSVPKGEDWMSPVGQKDVVTDKTSGSPSMGEKNALDTKDPLARQGLVPLELRRIPKKIPLADWTMLAYQIFVFAQAMLKAKLY
jgi:hypothetical protein